MNNIEHFVHPGVFRDLDKARATLELAKTAVQLDPVDSRAHLCCGWSYVMALREAEAAPHMELACELNDNDPWTLLSGAHYAALCGSIEQARLRAERALALSPAPSYLEWAYHSTVRFFCGDYDGSHRGVRSRARCHTRSCPHGARLRCSSSGSAQLAQEEIAALRERTAFILGWIVRSDRRGCGAVGDAGSSDQREASDGKPCATGLRGAGLPVDGIASAIRESQDRSGTKLIV